MVKKIKAEKSIADLKKEYLSLAIGKESLLKVITESEVAEQVFNSNAIENSTLTLEETEKILLQIDLDRFISERELFEAKNLARVMEYIEKRVGERKVTMDLILDLHKMLLGNIAEDIAGRFRSPGEYVRVGTYIAPAPEEVLSRIQDLLHSYEASEESMVKRLAAFHLGFEHIHPFCDGNGRIGRVLNNYLLLRDGYVPINIKFADRATYYQAFKEFDREGKTKIMEDIIALALSNSFHKRLAYLKGQQIIKLADFAKQTKQSYTNLLNKAKRQTIPAFMEKGGWKIGT